MDYISFSRRFFAATGVPVTLPEKGKSIHYPSLLWLRQQDGK